MRTLDPNTTLWLNADEKPPMFTGGVRKFGAINKKDKDGKIIDNTRQLPGLHYVPTTYADVDVIMKEMIDNDWISDDCMVFCLGHAKVKDAKVRMECLGNQATAESIEANFSCIFFSENYIKGEGESAAPSKRLRTQSLGPCLSHAPQNLFPLYIDNDYEHIRSKIVAYKNGDLE